MLIIKPTNRQVFFFHWRHNKINICSNQSKPKIYLCTRTHTHLALPYGMHIWNRIHKLISSCRDASYVCVPRQEDYWMKQSAGAKSIIEEENLLRHKEDKEGMFSCVLLFCFSQHYAPNLLHFGSGFTIFLKGLLAKITMRAFAFTFNFFNLIFSF